MLIRCGGFTVLTDPNFVHAGERLHFGYGVTAERRTNPAISFDELPPIDLVVLSHMHADHFDPLVEERLDRSIPILTTPEAASILRAKGFEAAHGLPTWDQVEVRKGGSTLQLTATPGQHGRLLFSALLPQVMGSVLEFRREQRGSYRVYITGDTLYSSLLAEVGGRFPELDLGVLHLGGTRVFGVLVTMDGEQGVRMIQAIPAKRWIPVHFDDYPLFKSPLSDFEEAVREAGLEGEVRYLQRGQTYEFEDVTSSAGLRGTVGGVGEGQS